MSRAKFEFDGRVAVITGAASGIGAALAEALAQRGCHLALADIDAAGLDRVAARIARPDRNLTKTRLDVGNSEDIAHFAQAVARDHGGAHVLFNNAGVALVGGFEELSAEDFDWLLSINLFGVVRMTRAFLPLLRQADSAQIVNISSIFGIIAPASQSAYCTSKYAVRGFSDCLRHELEGSSVGVTTVHPGGVATQIARNARVGAGSPAGERERTVRNADRLLVMAPAKAARIILDAVERRKARVLVGRDAHIAALIERLLPASYWRWIGPRAKDPV